MLLSSFIINDLMSSLSGTTILSKSCESIKSYEAKNLPVPIKKTYLAFSAGKHKSDFFTDENGEKMHRTDLTVCVNCYTPLTSSPANTHTVIETVMYYFSTVNELIKSFSVGATQYDKDVDAYKICCTIEFSQVLKAEEEPS